jgi:NAD(P)-dependent dehydrogenase (short-subunit alcohol dehydrogenase family)
MANVLITGCGSGLGLEAALAFARAGDTVFATVRDLGRADMLSAAAAAEGLELNIDELDVARPERFEAVLADVQRRAGRLDVLVNNAGRLPVGAFEDIDEAELRRVMEVNFFGPALLTRSALPMMRRQGAGYVIMVSSLSGLAGRAGDTAYAASKFALEGLTEALRHEVMRWNIKTALVEPGSYATGMFRAAPAGGCTPGSPYLPLIQAQQATLQRNLGQAGDPRHVGELLVEISRSDGRRFRWAADALAERVRMQMWAQDDAERDAFLRAAADVDWWIAGRDAPN